MQDEDDGKKLLQVLIEAQIISQAQSQLAQSDSENMGMTIDEVLLARGWLDKPILEKYAPWLFPKTDDGTAHDAFKSRNSGQIRQSTQIQMSDTIGSSDDYGTNLARYRAIMRDILD